MGGGGRYLNRAMSCELKAYQELNVEFSKKQLIQIEGPGNQTTQRRVVKGMAPEKAHVTTSKYGCFYFARRHRRHGFSYLINDFVAVDVPANIPSTTRDHRIGESTNERRVY